MTTTALPNAPGAPVAETAAPVSTVGDIGLFPIKLRLPEAVIAAGPDACERWFVDLTLANADAIWQMELTRSGELEVTMPPFAPTDNQEVKFIVSLENWNTAGGVELGKATGSSGAYRFPSGAIRYPDAAWTPLEKIPSFPTDIPTARPYCPDFVVEIRSTSQSRPSDLTELLDKMQEYMDNGALLGWLIDPIERTVRIYRAGVSEPELLNDPETLDGEDVLPGFTFSVRQLIFDLT
jgi:Uma2 family endonuclease